MKMKKQVTMKTYAILAVLLVLMVGSVVATAPMIRESREAGSKTLNGGEIAIGLGFPTPIDAEPEPTSKYLFKGEGYLLSSENNKFHLVDLKIIKKGSGLSGTFELMGIDMEIDGFIYGGMGSPGYSASMIKFDIKYKGYVVGSFDGIVKKAGSLRIIDGTFQGNTGGEWKLIGFN